MEMMVGMPKMSKQRPNLWVAVFLTLRPSERKSTKAMEIPKNEVVRAKKEKALPNVSRVLL